ncbi:MAG: hypothetical protein K6E54_07710 [Bacteroidaceae bacterium]|nr:hypothetical protein [Bacteroidaceae bacterium]
MKKKLLVTIISLLCFCNISKAQFYIGGGIGIGYLSDKFAFDIEPHVGYEINDKWALGLGIGALYDDEYSSTYVSTKFYTRYNVWNNNQFYFDIKGITNIWLDDEVEIAEIGFAPSFRFKASERVQFAANIGLLGVQYYDYEWCPALGVNAINTSLEIIYKF